MRIKANYDSHTKDELLAEVKARKLESVNTGSTKDEIIAALTADDNAAPEPEQPKPPLPKLTASNIPVVEASEVDTGIDAVTVPPDEDFTEGTYYLGSEPYALAIHAKDGYGNTHTLKNTLHLWQGNEEAFNATFSHKKPK